LTIEIICKNFIFPNIYKKVNQTKYLFNIGFEVFRKLKIDRKILKFPKIKFGRFRIWNLNLFYLNFVSKRKDFTALRIMEIFNEKVKKIDEKNCLIPAFVDTVVVVVVDPL